MKTKKLKDCDLIRSVDGGYKIINPDNWEEMAAVYDKDNLSLLAAAPDLLAALRVAAEALQALREGKRDGGTMGNASMALDVVDAAIAKATGGKP